MRVAVISDIHGNLLALDAVTTDIEAQGVDEVWCGGDIGFGGPWASECIARVREAGWPTVKGNTDVWLTGDPQTVDSPEGRKRIEALAAAHAISDDDARWLAGLPVGHTAPGGILLVHGTPDSPFQAPGPHAPEGAFEPYRARGSLVVYGHIHVAFTRRLADGTLVANTGAVGMPKDADTASYLLIDLDGAGFTLRHRRVAFDRRAGVAQARVVGDPIAELFLANVSA